MQFLEIRVFHVEEGKGLSELDFKYSEVFRDPEFERFHRWAKDMFDEVRRRYPNLVWNQPEISLKKITWKNLQGSIRVLCLCSSSGRKSREVYIDEIRRTDWDWME